MNCWLFVIGDRDALAEVVDRRLMAFRDGVRTAGLRKGDKVALYVTRGAFRNPTRDEARVFGVGTATSKLEHSSVAIAGEAFSQWIRFTFDRAPMNPREGLPFRPLVATMEFIRKKEFWSSYVRTALVPIPEQDWKRIDSALADFESGR